MKRFSVMAPGFCVRMKALLAVKTEHGLKTLMLNATRGQLLQDEVAAWRAFMPRDKRAKVHDAPAQVYMGDLQILVGNIGHDIDPTQPLSRLFILLLAWVPTQGLLKCLGWDRQLPRAWAI